MRAQLKLCKIAFPICTHSVSRHVGKENLLNCLSLGHAACRDDAMLLLVVGNKLPRTCFRESLHTTIDAPLDDPSVARHIVIKVFICSFRDDIVSHDRAFDGGVRYLKEYIVVMCAGAA